VLERDFLATTSKKRFLALRLVVALVAAIVVAVVAIDDHRLEPDRVGRSVFQAAAVVVPLLIALIAPATGAPCIATEREGGTLDLVLAAPVSPLTFVTAKFLSRFLALATLVLAATPVAAVCLLYGGVPIEDFTALLLLTLCFAATGVAAGVLMSAHIRSVSRALMTTYLLVFVGPLAPTYLLAYAAGKLEWSVAASVGEWLAPALHYYAWGDFALIRFRGGANPDVVYEHAAFVGVAVVIALLVAARRVAHENVGPRRAKKRRKQRGVFLGHPILDRGVRGSLLSHPGVGGFLLPGVALLICGGFLADALTSLHYSRGSHIAALGILTLLAMLRMLSATSGSIASERRRGSLDLLMATPMRSEEIAIGTLAAALLATSPLLVLGLVYTTIAVIAGQFSVGGGVAWFIISGALLLFTGSLGLRCSITARSPTHAALRTFGIFFGALAGSGLLMFLMAFSRHADDLIEYVAVALPVVMPFYGTWSVDVLFAHRGSPDVEGFLTMACATAIYAIVGALLMMKSAAALERSRD
jgi:ABC-type transport system involved in multi-copper enzyme maturation permease subunit